MADGDMGASTPHTAIVHRDAQPHFSPVLRERDAIREMRRVHAGVYAVCEERSASLLEYADRVFSRGEVHAPTGLPSGREATQQPPMDRPLTA